ncbi:MAG: hypothetical protein A2W25_12755 [candidate division Zixibacteria bacterium RBG_16_53_22]|nr:MAG: hypothetical protein A2W25_12755 [candidate division Zixibacteria bacterium RBG_16_53_22]
MNKILSTIRSVPGVWGAIAIDKKRALTYQLLPSTYDAEIVKSFAIPTLNLGRTFERNVIIDFFFENGKGRLYNRPEAVVLVLGRFELDFDLLNSICKEAVSAICRRFARAEVHDGGIVSSDGSNVSFEFLLKAVNILASNAQQKIGAYLVTKHLRNAKDKLVEKYDFLSTLTVDNNGVAYLIKGYPPYKGDDLLQGFAHWANLFISNCAKSTDKLDAADILELTIEIKDKLEMTGFYQLYADIGL